MRCPDCNKFVSFDAEEEPEMNVELNDGVVNVEARIVNNCGECGTELKEYTFQNEIDVSNEVEAHAKANRKCSEGGEFSVDADGSRTERTQTHDRNGKKLTGPMRYRKHYYGYEANVNVTCDTCGEVVFTKTVADEIQGSGMDELV